MRERKCWHEVTGKRPSAPLSCLWPLRSPASGWRSRSPLINSACRAETPLDERQGTEWTGCDRRGVNGEKRLALAYRSVWNELTDKTSSHHKLSFTGRLKLRNFYIYFNEERVVGSFVALCGQVQGDTKNGNHQKLNIVAKFYFISTKLQPHYFKVVYSTSENFKSSPFFY